MPEGTFRRPPQLWEQKLATLVAVNNVGTVAGSATDLVGSDLAPGDGGGGGAEPEPVQPSPIAFGTPSTPTLTGSVQGIMVTWDGLTSDGEVYPYESAVVEVHMSTTSGFTPSASTLEGELRYPGNFTMNGLTAGVTYYFKLRGRDAKGNYSTASAQASGTTGLTTSSDYGTASIGSGAVSFNARSIGGITTTVGSTQPTSPVAGDIWLDTTPLTATVTSASGNGSQITYTCSGGHSFAAGDSVTVAGTSGASFNRTATVLSDPAPTATTFVVTAAVSGSATGGTATGPTRGVIQKRWSGSAWVTQQWGPDTLSAATITARQIATAAITAGAIAAGSITAEKITADAIDGKTITGALIRTSSGAGRIVLTDSFADTLAFYNGNAAVAALYGGFNQLFVSATQLTCLGIVRTSQSFSSSNLESNTSSLIPNLRSGTDGTIVKTSHANSAQRFKVDIVPMGSGDLVGVEPQRLGAAQTVDPNAVLDLVPVQFSRVSDGASRTGFIAEDVEAKYPTAVDYDEHGVIEGVDVRGIVAGLLAVVKQQNERLAILEARIP